MLVRNKKFPLFSLFVVEQNVLLTEEVYGFTQRMRQYERALFISKPIETTNYYVVVLCDLIPIVWLLLLVHTSILPTKQDVRERKQHIELTISCVLKTNF